ncbi:hypothetical protein DQ04_01901000 [Trypanosoma grayi]|uniref:hypothetical protein n=1 Tax=Trypanosoma grayi TaxID=71804 RepID=UPI0004F48FC0|nr:hypothetical protein DQ04_01901000 [Trypanosoma grayi]KEG12194.1 hypothetical protein DQ04_01901000 [Trypanosoma grayi]
MGDDAIPDYLAVAGVAKEVLRALPFWKVFVELREACGRKPTVVSCDVSIKSRRACSHFVGVDVLWVQSEVVLVNRRRSVRRGGSKDAPHQYVEMHLSFGSMHFVHQNAHLIGGDRSYNLQSVVLLQRPEQMQCVAGNMVHFALLVYGMLHLSHRDNSVDARCATVPPSDSTVLVLGMGGNSMECGLRHVLGSKASIYVADVEPAVVSTCRSFGLLKENPNTHVYVQSAEEVLRLCPVNCNFVFMDVFEPVNGRMVNSMPLIKQAFNKLATDGILVINDHSLPTIEHLLPLMQLFGDHNVQVINIHGWNESVIAAIKPGGSVDGRGQNCSKRLAYDVLDAYESLYPGWMPTETYIQRSHILYAKAPSAKLRARQWTS